DVVGLLVQLGTVHVLIVSTPQRRRRIRHRPDGPPRMWKWTHSPSSRARTGPLGSRTGQSRAGASGGEKLRSGGLGTRGSDITTTFGTSAILPAPPHLPVRARFVDDVDRGRGFPFQAGRPTTVEQPLELLPTSGFSCWVRNTSGLIGFGRTLRIRARGPERFTQLSAAWKAITAVASVEDEVDLLGSGLMCFATVAYSGESAVDSIIHVPEFVLGRRGGRVWLTSISTNATPPTPPVLQAEPLRRVASARATDGN